MQRRTGLIAVRLGAALLCVSAAVGASLLLALCGRSTADDGADGNGATNGDTKAAKSLKSPMPAFTPEREAAAVTFVSANHPELAPLLAGLKIGRPGEYQKAIRKLFGDSERLAHSRENHPRRYELELREWKLDSRAQLLVAKLSMGRTPELELQLRKLLAEQVEVQRELLSLERERLAQRTAALDEAIAKLDADREKLLDERLEKALKSVGRNKPPAKANKDEGKTNAPAPDTAGEGTAAVTATARNR